MSEENDSTENKIITFIIVIGIFIGYNIILSIQESDGYMNENYTNCNIVKNVERYNPLSRWIGEYICSEWTCIKLYYNKDNQCTEARIYENKIEESK